jgi:hypothetical protein
MTFADAGSNSNRNLQGHNYYMATDRLPSGSIRASESDRKTPTLDEFGVNLTQIAAEIKYCGEVEEGFKKIVEEIRQAGNVILEIDEFQILIGAGAIEKGLG